MNFRIALPGSNRIPPANDHVPEAAPWVSTLTASDFQRIAAVIDEHAYDTITTSEHFAMPYFEVPRLGAYWMDALSVMAFLAGSTQRVRIDAHILVAPYHHPLPFAKALSTIDVLSGGRLDVSVGVGHTELEFEALGVPFGQRGDITDETLEAISTLWSDEEPVFHGQYFDIEGLAFEPKPVQKPRPPIHIGGNSRRALRRAARYDGWQVNPTTFSLEEMPPLVEYLQDQRELVSKGDSFDISWIGTIPGVDRPSFAALTASDRSGFGEQILERLDYLREFGITSVMVPVPETSSTEEYLDFVRWFAEAVIGDR